MTLCLFTFFEILNFIHRGLNITSLYLLVINYSIDRMCLSIFVFVNRSIKGKNRLMGMKVYGIGGLGADVRVFSRLHLDADFIFINWIKAKPNEDITDYAKRLSSTIDKNSEFALLGVSFGGLIAIEMCKLLNPKIVFLVSSAEVKSELSPLAILAGRISFLSNFPVWFFKPPKRIVRFVFGAKDRRLLNDILDDTDPSFVKWALFELMTWQNTERLKFPLIKIMGTKDLLFPPSRASNTMFIENGGHYMIVDRASEISELINSQLRILQ